MMSTEKTMETKGIPSITSSTPDFTSRHKTFTLGTKQATKLTKVHHFISDK
jgi:hypothetical protein